MLVSDFSYHLPPELIARQPQSQRDASRLMLLDRLTGAVGEDIFSALPDYLRPGDLLVMNDTRVIPARLFGTKSSGGKVEIFLLKRLDAAGSRWECLLKSSKRFRPGQEVQLSSGMTAVIIMQCSTGNWQIDFHGEEQFDSWLEREGHMPLPPYIQREDDAEDRERYQTVMAAVPGAVAAPTAGLHFTRELLSRLRQMQVESACVTLHTGLGTFQPVRVAHVEDHRIHTERYAISAETAAAVSRTKAGGGRVVAVGTTTARTLEYAARNDGVVDSGCGEADIFIYPGYRFKVIDALITNFHLPESTLLMLVSAFAGREPVLNAYMEAIARRFRFYSYGDAMLIS